MPDFPPVVNAPRTTARAFTISTLHAGGDASNVQLSDLPVTVSGAELAAVRDNIGALTNGAVWQTSNAETVTVSKARVAPLDEAYASASEKLLLSWQDDDLNIKQIAIPAPDESYFGADGVTIRTPDGAAAAGTPARVLFDSIAAITLVLNGGALAAPAGTYVFLKGYRSSRARKQTRPRTVRSSVEPSAAQEPGPEPGV